MDLLKCHHRTIAVIVTIQGDERVFRGRGACELKAPRRYVLRVEPIETSHAGNPVFLIDDHHWRGEISRGRAYGCDFCLRLDPDPQVGG